MDVEKKLNLPLLDFQKIEAVLARLEKKHIRHTRGAVIFIGSGGGKSTTYRHQTPNHEGKFDLVDADLVYRETGAHPCEPGVVPLRPIPWWDMGIEIIQEVEKRCGIVNQAMVEKGFWSLTTSFTPVDKYVPDDIVVVLLPWAEHKKRIIEKSSGDYYDAGAKADEQGFALVKQHREWAKQIAEEKNIPIVKSIKEAVETVRSRK